MQTPVYTQVVHTTTKPKPSNGLFLNRRKTSSSRKTQQIDVIREGDPIKLIKTV